MIKNTASQLIGAQIITAANGSAFTGSVTCYVCGDGGDGGTQALGGTGSGVCTSEGNGYYSYAPTQAETNYSLIAFTFIGSGAIPVTVQVFTQIVQQTADHTAAIADIPTNAELAAAVANVSVDEIQASALADLFNTNSGTTYASAISGSVVSEIADNAGGSSLTASGIADAVWDEDLTEHTDVDSTGEALGSAVSGGVSAGTIAGAVWDAATATYTDADSFGKLINDNLDAPVSIVDTVVDSIKTKTDNLPSDPADQSLIIAATDAIKTDTAAILLDTDELQTDDIPGKLVTLDAVVDTVKADTANILIDTNELQLAQSDWVTADISSLATTSALNTHDGKLDTVDAIVDDILVDTSITIPAALNTADEIAAAILKLDWTGLTGEANRSMLNALRFLRNKWTAAGGTLTVTKEDDTTAAWTAALTSDSAADPITGSDPA